MSQLADQSFDSSRKKRAIDALEAAVNRLQDRGADYAVEPLHRHSKTLNDGSPESASASERGIPSRMARRL